MKAPADAKNLSPSVHRVRRVVSQLAGRFEPLQAMPTQSAGGTSSSTKGRAALPVSAVRKSLQTGPVGRYLLLIEVPAGELPPAQGGGMINGALFTTATQGFASGSNQVSAQPSKADAALPGVEQTDVSDALEALNLILKKPRYSQAQGAAAAVVLALPLLEQTATLGTRRSEIAASIFDVSQRYIFDLKKLRATHPNVFTEILRGEITLQSAKRQIQRGRRD